MADPFALDPLSTVIRLALLSGFKPGVKIGIVNNTIVIHRPTLIDRMLRTGASFFTQGCTKHALFHLRLPLERAVAWYHHEVPLLFDMALEGLRVLAESYASDPADGNVTSTIQLVIKILEECDAVAPEPIDDKPALQRLRDAWSTHEIAALRLLVPLLLDGDTSMPRESVINSVEELLRGKEAELFAIIRSSPMAAAEVDRPVQLSAELPDPRAAEEHPDGGAQH